tara:strand:+ start:469 stop:657 length:189 start_codon:yes stop_codon:yes gene_type:complete
MKKTYQFDVPCVYYYEIDANTEEQAKKILQQKGGISIDGDLLIQDYGQATLVGVLEKKESEE